MTARSRRGAQRSRSGGFVGVLAALLGLAIAASACGIPIAASPKVLADSVLPRVLNQPVETLPQPPPHNIDAVQVPVYLLNPDLLLTKAEQYVRRPATPQAALDALAAGPTSAQAQLGYSTAIPQGSHPSVQGIVKGVAVVELDATFFRPTGELPALECGQVVLTLTTAFPYIKAVRFYFGGAPTQAEIEFGQVVFRAVTPVDYKSLKS